MLERKTIDSNGSSSPGKLGLFSIALVMCVCCLSSFFSPIGTDGDPSAVIKHNGVGGKNLMFVDGSTLDQSNDYLASQNL